MKETYNFCGIPAFSKERNGNDMPKGEIAVMRNGDTVNISFTKRGDNRINGMRDNNSQILFYSEALYPKKLRKKIRNYLNDFKSKNFDYVVNDDQVLSALILCANNISYPMSGSLAVRVSDYKNSHK